MRLGDQPSLRTGRAGERRLLRPDSDGPLFFVLGDVSKGVAASMPMTQLHALFRSITKMALPLGQMVSQANRVFCESPHVTPVESRA
jgi:hypothetical protein